MDYLSDALTRIKNGYLAQKTEVNLPYSKLIMAVSQVLKDEGYVADVKEVEPVDRGFKMIQVELKYENRKPALMDLKRVSKPGLRIYKSKKSLPWVLNGMGIALISTPKGIMTDKKARKEGLGGEVMAFIW